MIKNITLVDLPFFVEMSVVHLLNENRLHVHHDNVLGRKSIVSPVLDK